MSARSSDRERCVQSKVEYLVGRICEVCMYTDSVVPGNNLRPDLGRSYEVVALWDWHVSPLSE